MNTTGRFEGKVMIVTGAAQGIGEGVAIAAAAEGATLVIADRSPLLHEVAARIAGSGAAVTPVIADLETYAGAKPVVQAALDAHGRVDILVNNVGGTIWAKPYQEYEEAQIEAEIRRSLFPTMWCCHAVLGPMIERQHGVIVNVSSIATRSIHRIPYAAAKGDLPTPPADGRFLAEGIPGARYVELEAAHLSNQELPEQFSLMLREFLHQR